MNGCFTRGIYVHVIGEGEDGQEEQVWAGEMQQVPAVGDRVRLMTGGGSYRLYWVEAVAWVLHTGDGVDGAHGEEGQPFVYVK